MQEMSVTQLIWHWTVMSTWMMAPLALILAARTRKTFSFLIVSVASFVAVWIALGIPVALVLFELFRVNGKYVGIALLAVAAAYQFSKRHGNAILGCMNTSDDNLWFGVRTGWSCFVACGPLMVAIYALMPSNAIAMAGVTILMVAEFVAINRQTIARTVGLVAAVAAVGMLFMSGPIPFSGNLNLGNSHTHTH